MLQSNTNPIFSAALHNLDSQMALWTSLANKTLDYTNTLTSLNMAAMRDALDQAGNVRQQTAAAGNPADVYQSLLAQAQPNLEKSIAYGREVAAIATSMQAELSNTVQRQMSDSKQSAGQLFSGAKGTLPDGSANLIDLFRSGYAQFAKSAIEATETMQANMANATSSFQDHGRAESRAKK